MSDQEQRLIAAVGSGSGGEDRRRAQTRAGPPPGCKGRVLRVKHGYNPNSSSIGSIVFLLPAALLVAGAGFGAVAALIWSALTRADISGGPGDGAPGGVTREDGDSPEPRSETSGKAVE